MAENQILPFAYADGANVLSQSDYQADNQRLIGHQPGIARSALENKALRQATTVTAGLAQFIADGQAVDVTDSKTPVEIAAMLLAANSAQMPRATTQIEGLIRAATNAEAAALTNANAALTPSGLAQAFSQNAQFASSYAIQKLPGVEGQRAMLQWGNFQLAANAQGRAVAFPQAFIGEPLIFGSPRSSVQSNGLYVFQVTNTNFTIYSSVPIDHAFMWFAIGLL